MKTPTYIRCPRCELNYIVKKDKYCEVCKQEMKISKNNSFDIDEETEMEICPICKANYIQEDEIMCASCAKEKALEDGLYNNDSDTNWTEYLDDEDESILDNEELGEMVSITDGEDEEDVEDDDDDYDDDDDFDLDDIDDDDDDFDDDDDLDDEDDD